MREIIGKLLELCETDRAIHALNQQLALYPKMLAELSVREESAKKKEAAALDSFNKARESRRKAELEVRGLREKIDKYLGQQAMVKTNKEYAAITHEINGVKAKIEEIDLAGLEALEEEERSEKERQKIAASRKALEDENQTERNRIESQSSDKKKRLAQLQAERAQKAEFIPSDTLEVYDLLNERHPGTALTKIESGCCGGCGMTLIRQIAFDLRKAEKLVRCEGCSRILYDPAALNAPLQEDPTLI